MVQFLCKTFARKHFPGWDFPDFPPSFWWCEREEQKPMIYYFTHSTHTHTHTVLAALSAFRRCVFIIYLLSAFRFYTSPLFSVFIFLKWHTNTLLPVSGLVCAFNFATITKISHLFIVSRVGIGLFWGVFNSFFYILCLSTKAEKLQWLKITLFSSSKYHKCRWLWNCWLAILWVFILKFAKHSWFSS